jgi:hypothetical protein
MQDASAHCAFCEKGLIGIRTNSGKWSSSHMFSRFEDGMTDDNRQTEHRSEDCNRAVLVQHPALHETQPTVGCYASQQIESVVLSGASAEATLISDGNRSANSQRDLR